MVGFKIVPKTSVSRLIEADSFPFEFLSVISTRESWRKEIYRPIYHVHKWWAKRLGSIFRGIALGCFLPEGADLETAFYYKQDYSNVSIFDPFMGSGTTVGEAHKLGCIALGRDINPVACESVRIALGQLDRNTIIKAHSQLSATVGQRIRELYYSHDEKGQPRDVLYYFWVKQIPCPYCQSPVELFASRVIASNAYPDRKPEIQVCCPGCGDIFPSLNTNTRVNCRTCMLEFDPQVGAANGAKATCQACSQSFSIIDAVRRSGRQPSHRLYGKLLLIDDEEKHYLPATPGDIQLYNQCSVLLQQELDRGAIRLPELALSDGYNTRQAMGYNYYYWRDFFNDRQLLALGWLQAAIAELPDVPVRDALFTLFSGTLEFNNLFASYKGEGTGAVRHMFAHHILKPERTPIEANVWGTAKSSGSFSNLFKSRLLRAIDYRQAPFEVRGDGKGKAYHASSPFSGIVESSWPVQGNFKPGGIYLSCGSSDQTGLPDESIDHVITDPPFFDNVHYSELADFFYAWQSLYPHGFINSTSSTRSEREVQDTSGERFAAKLQAVFTECYRVLKDRSLLVFTYHHSRSEGWVSLVRAVYGAGFTVVNAHPVKAELSLAAPKSQAKEPIQLDIIMVCRKRGTDSRSPLSTLDALELASKRAQDKLNRLTSIGLTLSRNDRRIVVISQYIASLGSHELDVVVNALLENELALEALVTSPSENFSVSGKPGKAVVQMQLRLFEEASPDYLAPAPDAPKR